MPRLRRQHAIRNWTRSLLVRLLLGAWIAGAAVPAADIKIIVNASVKVSALSREQLQRVFLLKSNSLPDGTQVEPVLTTGSPAYQLFLKEYLGKSDAALSTYYRSLVFTGKALMPKTVDSDLEVVAYVARTKGAVGFVNASTQTEGVRSVMIR